MRDLLLAVAALKVPQAFSRAKYVAGVDFFKAQIRNVEREGVLVVLLMQVVAVFHQFQDNRFVYIQMLK